MKYSSCVHRIYLISGLVCSLFLSTHQQQYSPARKMSDSLTEIHACYKNKTLSDRLKRLPMSIENFIAILDDLESHPSMELSQPKDVANLLIYRFRQDGIHYHPELSAPFTQSPSEGDEQKKMDSIWDQRMDFRQFSELALKDEQKCSLHWMLSYTINATCREGEDVMCIDTYISPSRKYYITAQKLDPRNNARVNIEAGNRNSNSNSRSNFKQNGNAYSSRNMFSQSISDASDWPSAQNVRVPDTKNSYNPNDRRSSDWFSDPFFRKSRSGPRRKRASTGTDVRASEPRSVNPLELGVVQTPYGAVTIGSVVAAFKEKAYGKILQASSVFSTEFKGILKKFPWFTDAQFDSSHAVTVAGDIGQTALLRHIDNTERPLFGPGGVFNNSECPREYSLSSKDVSFLTDAEIRGDIDGLILSQNHHNFGSLKLSNILEGYYSEAGITTNSGQRLRACDRLKHFQELYLDDVITEQSKLMAWLLIEKFYRSTLEPANLTEVVSNYVEQTANQFRSYISSGEYGDPSCATTYQSSNYGKSSQQRYGKYAWNSYTEEYTIDPKLDIYMIMDNTDTSYQDIRNQRTFIARLIHLLEVKRRGSRMALISSLDGSEYFSINYTTNRAELACEVISLPDTFRNVQNLPKAISEIRKRFLYERQAERMLRLGGTNGKYVIILLHRNSISTNSDNDLKEELKYFRDEMPDVKLLILTQMTRNELNNYVENATSDIISFGDLSSKPVSVEVAEKLKLFPARLIAPNCLRTSDSDTIGLEYVGFIQPNKVQYFQYHPYFFHLSPNIKINLSTRYGAIKACASREHRNPIDGLPNVQCKNSRETSSNVEFQYESVCHKGRISGCSPVYISVYGLEEGNVVCSGQDCPSPNDIRFTITPENMRCSACRAAFLSWTLCACLILVRITSKSLFSTTF